ncbi:MAG: DUF6391 domain-containing protein [Bacillota bacterium]
MGLLFLLLILAFFFPVLLYPLVIFLGLFLLFIPIKFTIDSFFNIFFIPRQIYQIATNSRLRKNHALEHATVNVLEKDFGYNRLSGYATENGFYIIGAQDINYVLQGAKQGLQLMRNGQGELAIHDHCGTSRIVANFVSAIIFIVLLVTTGQFSIFNIIIALLLAHMISPVLGKFVQRNFTTTPDVEEMEIDSAKFETNGSVFSQKSAKIFVKTSEIPFVS